MSSSDIKISKGDIFLIDLKDTYSNVQSGLRPCLIVQNDYGNAYSPTIIVVPITTKIKKTNMPVHVIFEKHVGNKKSYDMALCECILTVSREQIKKYLGTLEDKMIDKVNNALEVSLGLKD